ncbi:unnamed protein product [Amoebophrya sp. A120]|nr:unnamed protein product [Amoebophrya sp. A120]|eukprot:GSA120T00007034001.1
MDIVHWAMHCTHSKLFEATQFYLEEMTNYSSCASSASTVVGEDVGPLDENGNASTSDEALRLANEERAAEAGFLSACATSAEDVVDVELQRHESFDKTGDHPSSSSSTGIELLIRVDKIRTEQVYERRKEKKGVPNMHILLQDVDFSRCCEYSSKPTAVLAPQVSALEQGGYDEDGGGNVNEKRSPTTTSEGGEMVRAPGGPGSVVTKQKSITESAKLSVSGAAGGNNGNNKIAKQLSTCRFHPARRQFANNFAAYLHKIKDLYGLHVTTSCYNFWKQQTFKNGGAKVIPAFSYASRTCVFFFDDNLEFFEEEVIATGGNNVHPGNRSSSTTNVGTSAATSTAADDKNLQGVEQGLKTSSQKSVTKTPTLGITKIKSRRAAAASSARTSAGEGGENNINASGNIGNYAGGVYDASCSRSSQLLPEPQLSTEFLPGILNLRDVSGRFVDFSIGKNGFEEVSSCVYEDGYSSTSSKINPMNNDDRPAGDQVAANSATSSTRETTCSPILYSKEYNVVLCKVCILDAMTDDEFFTRIIERFSRPKERIMIFMDVNSTIVFGDLMSGKDPDFVLLSTLFEAIILQPKETFVFDYDPNKNYESSGGGVSSFSAGTGTSTATTSSSGRRKDYPAATPTAAPSGVAASSSTTSSCECQKGRQIALKKLVKNFLLQNDREAYKKFWKPENCKKLLQYCLLKGNIKIYGKTMTKIEDFDLLYHEYALLLKRTKGGIVRSWFELYRKYHENSLIMINTFGVDSRKVIHETVTESESDVQMFSVNYDQWSDRDKKKFQEQYTPTVVPLGRGSSVRGSETSTTAMTNKTGQAGNSARTTAGGLFGKTKSAFIKEQLNNHVDIDKSRDIKTLLEEQKDELVQKGAPCISPNMPGGKLAQNVFYMEKKENLRSSNRFREHQVEESCTTSKRKEEESPGIRILDGSFLQFVQLSTRTTSATRKNDETNIEDSETKELQLRFDYGKILQNKPFRFRDKELRKAEKEANVSLVQAFKVVFGELGSSTAEEVPAEKIITGKNKKNKKSPANEEAASEYKEGSTSTGGAHDTTYFDRATLSSIVKDAELAFLQDHLNNRGNIADSGVGDQMDHHGFESSGLYQTGHPTSALPPLHFPAGVCSKVSFKSKAGTTAALSGRATAGPATEMMMPCYDYLAAANSASEELLVLPQLLRDICGEAAASGSCAPSYNSWSGEDKTNSASGTKAAAREDEPQQLFFQFLQKMLQKKKETELKTRVTDLEAKLAQKKQEKAMLAEMEEFILSKNIPTPESTWGFCNTNLELLEVTHQKLRYAV